MTQASASKTDLYLTEADQFSAHNYKPLPVVLERGKARGFGTWTGTDISTCFRRTRL